MVAPCRDNSGHWQIIVSVSEAQNPESRAIILILAVTLTVDEYTAATKLPVMQMRHRSVSPTSLQN